MVDYVNKNGTIWQYTGDGDIREGGAYYTPLGDNAVEVVEVQRAYWLGGGVDNVYYVQRGTVLLNDGENDVPPNRVLDAIAYRGIDTDAQDGESYLSLGKVSTDADSWVIKNTIVLRKNTDLRKHVEKLL